jgi:hypothetical protein
MDKDNVLLDVYLMLKLQRPFLRREMPPTSMESGSGR